MLHEIDGVLVPPKLAPAFKKAEPPKAVVSAASGLAASLLMAALPAAMAVLM